MFIKNLFHPWRQNIALHATLTTKIITRIDDETRDLVQMSSERTSENKTMSEKIKLLGITGDGIEVYVDIELIGPPYQLHQFKFKEGQHVGLVLRAID